MSTHPRPRHAGKRIIPRDSLPFVLFFGPNLILLILFTYWPLARNVWLSVHRWDLISPARPWVGLENYRYIVTNPDAGTIVTNTAVYTLGVVGGTMSLGLLVALLLNQPLRGRTIARTVIFAPYVVSGVAIAIIWLFMFDTNFGLLQRVLHLLRLSSPNWTRDPRWAMPGIIIVSAWKNLGYAVVVFLAGLQSIPRELHESARVDGAGAWSRFRNVTLPHLSPVLFFVLVTSMIGSLQAFDIINVMTKGGPVNATSTLMYRLYEEGFVAFNAGRAAAYSVVLFVVMLAVTAVQLRFLERRVHYS